MQNKVPQKEKKIKTITCHDVYNFGASLQAYALMKYLQNLGHQVEIINYKPDYMNYKIWSVGDRWKKNILIRFLFLLYVVPLRLRLKSRRSMFDLFTRNWLTVTAKKYLSNDDLKRDPPVADIYFAGSDQIWNTSHHHGKDPAFYLDFVPSNAVRASYAASFSISQIPSEYSDFVKSKLEKIDAISVREKSGLNILSSLNIESGIVVLDPVFLLDMDKWDQLASYNTNEKYILIYDQENNSLIKNTAKRLAKEKNLKIYAITSLYPMYYANNRIITIGPQEFLGLIKNCEFLLTNSFHGTAFSLIFQKQFFTFKRTHEKVNSRMIDLLEMFKLSDRIINDYEDTLHIKEINYHNISQLIEEKIQNSKLYINNVLKIKK